MANASDLPAARTYNLEHQYGCPAHMTVVYFVACGLVHVARRLWRSDLPTTGKIELYTICPLATYVATAFAEDWLRYVDEFNPSRVDLQAMRLVAAAEGSAYRIVSLAADQAARFEAIEL